ncbi:hypothetical protein NUW58_g5268 [Xylaria curta]|uniref:Uncharacterized protein n=1 Tax=Xylaria curta TaxID=42375 RepID=A0ACC1P371_9PEZI|nr:hypothetical protein NUW58_g5268 [Xylaria curta]
MALATVAQYSETHKDDRAGGNSARNEDFPMPQPRRPPSPPMTETETETDTDIESPSLPSQPPASFGQESRKTNAHADPTAEASSLPDPSQNSAGPTLYLDTNMEATGNANASMDTNSPTQSSIISPVTSPPYWTARNGQSHPSGHGRTVSSASAESLIPAGLGITLRDNENSSIDDRGDACWARSVEVTDYVTINGSATNIGAFVVWNIRVETLNVWKLYEYPKAIFRIRRLSVAAHANISRLRGSRARTPAKKPHLEVPA